MTVAALDTELEQVRQILLGDEYRDLLRFRSALEDDQQFVRRVAAVIAESLQARAAIDDSVAAVLMPTIERAISESIEQDPRKLAVSLYPVMGPAIRKSISETLQQMLDSVNQLLEASLSLRTLRWRLDAWRTGRSYAEIVLHNTLEYRVEQVFLIHRETSLLLQHQVAAGVEVRDGDMVSGMLSAIQDFIEDSFSTHEGDNLDTLRLGDLTVVLQRGPYALLATVVRGRVPEQLRHQQTVALEKIHRFKHNQLRDFRGDTDEFAELGEDLRHLLTLKRKSDRKSGTGKIPWLAVAAVITLLAAVGYWQYTNYQVRQADRQLLAALEREPGLVLLHAHASRDELQVSLLADPLARAPADVVGAQGGERVVRFELQGFVSTEPEIVRQRAYRMFVPDERVSIEISNGTLRLDGRATSDWLAVVSRRWPDLAGVDALDTDALEVYNPRLEQLEQLTAEVEALHFSFATGAADIDPDGREVSTLVTAIRRLNDLHYQEFQRPVQLDLVGYTDGTGPRAINSRIGFTRAEALRKVLLAHGVGNAVLRVYNSFEYEGDGSSERKARIVVRFD